MRSPRKTRIAQVVLIVFVVLFAIRESRILWGAEAFKVFDLGFWGIYISEEVYTIQNMVVILGGVLVLALLSRRDSSKVPSEKIHAPEKERSGVSKKSRARRERIEAPETNNPFEMVNKNWKLVFRNPKQEEKSKNV